VSGVTGGRRDARNDRRAVDGKADTQGCGIAEDVALSMSLRHTPNAGTVDCLMYATVPGRF
jgi:hypothetical protein